VRFCLIASTVLFILGSSGSRNRTSGSSRADASEQLPGLVVDLTPVFPVEVDGVENLAVDVELKLIDRVVADPHQRGSATALEVTQLDLRMQALAADAVQDLHVLGAPDRGPYQPTR
jgi:hypothetical protein